MSLLFLESCEVGYCRWTVEGATDYSPIDGLVSQKAFIIIDGQTSFENRITRQFRTLEEYVNQRMFRLSFWMKTNRNIAKNSEFISVFSKKENQGGIIGLDKTGRFYIGYLTNSNEWAGTWAKTNLDQPRVDDGKYHFVELNVCWDSNDGAYVILYVDGKEYLRKTGANVFDDKHCWSRPDTISFGNLIGTDMFLDDIIMWDDIGSEYIGQKGPKRISHVVPLSFTETTAEECKEYLFETFISNLARGAEVTIMASEQSGSTSNVSVVFKNISATIKGSPVQLVSENEKPISLILGPQSEARTWIGFEKT